MFHTDTVTTIHGQGRRATEGRFYITGGGPVPYLLCSLFGQKHGGGQLWTHVLPTVYSECAEGITALAVGKMFMLSTDNSIWYVVDRSWWNNQQRSLGTFTYNVTWKALQATTLRRKKATSLTVPHHHIGDWMMGLLHQ